MTKERERDFLSLKSPGHCVSRQRPGRLGFAAPREEFAKLKRSPVMKPIDNKPVYHLLRGPVTVS
jgi:hypothetical protein